MSTPAVPESLPDLRADAERLARLVLAEDGERDLTTESVPGTDRPAEGTIELRSRGVVAGRPYAQAVARAAGCRLEWLVREGEVVERRSVGRLQGSLAAILRAERPLLNLLQRASGIATATRACVDAVAGTSCRVLHTRKTAPGLRLFDVAAVVAGGGTVHRLGLAHTVLIKDNHWKALGGSGAPLAEALQTARRSGALDCQAEVESEQQVDLACAAGADRLLIDNQPPTIVRVWAARARSRKPAIAIEASGGITAANARAYAEAGADFISLGALTHSVTAPDLAIEVR